MEPLRIATTEDTPEIIFDPAEGVFEISRRSLPENAIEFYQPVFQWLETYLKESKDDLSFDFKLEYFNTASAKQIAKLLLYLEKFSVKSDVTVRWHYDKADTDMLTSGSRYAKLINVNFEFVEN